MIVHLALSFDEGFVLYFFSLLIIQFIAIVILRKAALISERNKSSTGLYKA